MPNAVQMWVAFEGASTRQDRSLKITLGTQELPDEACAKLFGLRGKELYCALLETDYEHPIKLSDIEVPDRDPEFPRQKSPSERLRNVMYVYYKQQNGTTEGFEVWRVNEVEKLIEHYKSELNPE